MIKYLKTNCLNVAINTLGAELNSVKVNGKEMIWQNQNGTWGGHAPILFPMCGNCAIIVNGKKCDMRRHGIARINEFEIVDYSDTEISLMLKSNAETLKVYPFEFELTVYYKVHGNGLTIEYIVKNVGKKDMYFSCGGHESFNIDKPLSSYALEFNRQEKFLSLLTDDEGLRMGETEDFGSGKILNLPESFLQDSRTAVFGGIKSDKVTFKEIDGKDIADIYFEGFNNLLLWRPKSSPVICIEPWYNLPDKIGDKREAKDKDSLIKLSPNGERRFVRKIIYY